MIKAYAKTDRTDIAGVTAGRLYEVYFEHDDAFSMHTGPKSYYSAFWSEGSWQRIEAAPLADWDPQEGDVFRLEQSDCEYTGFEQTIQKDCGGLLSVDKMHNRLWSLVSRAVDTPKKWGDMTDEEKGALLLAHHEGEVIECLSVDNWYVCEIVVWDTDCAYRIKPEPKRETVEMGGSYVGTRGGFTFNEEPWIDCTYRITFETVDGKPDCASVKMEKIDET